MLFPISVDSLWDLERREAHRRHAKEQRQALARRSLAIRAARRVADPTSE